MIYAHIFHTIQTNNYYSIWGTSTIEKIFKGSVYSEIYERDYIETLKFEDTTDKTIQQKLIQQRISELKIQKDFE